MKMTKVSKKAKFKNVACVLVYTDNTYLYADSDKENKYSKDEVYDLFCNGMVVVTSGGMFKPTSADFSGTAASVSYMTETSGTAATVTLYSKEHT